MAALLGAVSGTARANHPANSCIDVEPETANVSTGATHAMTATMRTLSGEACTGAPVTPDSGSVQFAADITGPNDPDGGGPSGVPDLDCNLSPNKSDCSLEYQGANAGTDTLTAWIDHDKDGAMDADERSDQVQVSWTAPSPGQPTRLDCDPEKGTARPGSVNRVTCTATDSAGTVVGDVMVSAEGTGANDLDSSGTNDSPDFSCTTVASGKCTFDHGPSGTTGQGTTVYIAWIDADKNAGTVEADTQEGADEKKVPGVQGEPDATDVVEVEWKGDPVGPECPGFEGDPRPDVVGTNGGEQLVGTDKAEIICALGGDDVVDAGDGNDLVIGGADNDTIRGGGGNDILRGGAGNDSIFGGPGKDTLRGAGGDDVLRGGGGDDLLVGAAGTDTCLGGPGRDQRTRCEG